MTKSTSSIYKHQSRKHASSPKVVHKYSIDDPTKRSVVAVLQQKTLKGKRERVEYLLDYIHRMVRRRTHAGSNGR